MKKNLTELVMILDRSGSMCGLESDTIGGYNSMLRKQREADGEVLVSTVLFDDRSEVLYDRVPIEKMPQMTRNEYYVRGCTALLDAVGGAIHHIGNVHKYAREEDRPEKTIFVITTDGRFGISPDRAANYNSDHEGTALNYEVLSDAVCEMRAASAPIGAGWKKRIDEDFRRRGKK